MNYKYIFAFDPSTQAIGVAGRTYAGVFTDVITPRTNKVSEKTGKELKSSYYDKNKVINEVIKLIEKYGLRMENPKDILIILPDNGGNLNVSTIKKLERLNGMIETIFCCLVGSDLIIKKDICDVVYINEMKARSQVLKETEGETWKDKALNKYRLDDDNKADARVLLQYVMDEMKKEDK